VLKVLVGTIKRAYVYGVNIANSAQLHVVSLHTVRAWGHKNVLTFFKNFEDKMLVGTIKRAHVYEVNIANSGWLHVVSLHTVIARGQKFFSCPHS
jgi:hypothetical protein